MTSVLVKPRLPPGVMELLPKEQLAFAHMLDVVRRGFERFGFLPIETPAFELTEMLLTKSGGETEKQVYFVQSTGALKQQLKEGESPELALRFDLTVPLARYVAQHEPELNFPFRRSQIQRVYRGERNQKGRFREFYQCDIDVIGKDHLPLAYDAEIPAVIYGIFKELNVGDFTISFNNRKLLRGLLEGLGIEPAKHASVLHEVDRLGKMERAEIEKRLTAELLTPELSTKLLDVLTAPPGDSRGTLERLAHFEPKNDTFTTGLDELKRVYETVLALGVPEKFVKLNLSIVRGLDYYTGTVYETFLDAHPKLGSICSGGRYENLAGLYTKSRLPGVGISIGATRLFEQLLEMGVFAKVPGTIAPVVVMNLEPALALHYAELAAQLRQAGINTEVYGPDDKLGKQFKYADRAGFALAIIVGSREQQAGEVKVKDLAAQQETAVPRAQLVEHVRALLETLKRR